MIETAIVSALLPAGIEAVKNVFGAISRRWFGLSVDDQIKLENAGVERLKALAQLDTPVGQPSQWVVDLRAAFRYVACGLFVGVGVIKLIWPDPIFTPLAVEAAVSASSFIFGERMLLALGGGGKK